MKRKTLQFALDVVLVLAAIGLTIAAGASAQRSDPHIINVLRR